MKKILSATVFTCAAGLASAAGFGLYEASARGNAIGGGLVGSTGDASANYYNPANLTEGTNASVMVGISMINPFCDVKVDGIHQRKMNAGWFPPPHAYASAPLTDDLFLGFGMYCEYGLGTEYDGDWALRGDTTETTIEQFTFNPNLAYKLTDDWSIGLGARMSYITFENYKTPLDTDDFRTTILHPLAGPMEVSLGRQYIRTHLEGDDFSCGYQLGTQYKVTDAFRLGLVYRSRINHRIEGDLDSTHIDNSGQVAAQNAPRDGSARAKLVLPASVTLGANYDISTRLRMGAAVTWTEWSTVDHIDFRLPKKYSGASASYREDLRWDNAWRVGFGFEYDITENFTGGIGYTYDMDPSHKDYGTTMLPPGDRHIVGFGVGYRFFDAWRLNLGYNFIIMEATTRNMTAMDAASGGERSYRFECDNSYSHIISASVSYTF